ncbi:MAG: hypothetical protein WAV05_10340 [Anaerolineales bacterium]
MFDDFRKQMDDSAFYEEDKDEETPVEIVNQGDHILGMTPVQRFVVAVMLLLMTVILGVLFLLVTSKIAPPFFS